MTATTPHDRRVSSEMEQQQAPAPMPGQLAEPAARAAAWGGLALCAAGLLIATLRNLRGGD